MGGLYLVLYTSHIFRLSITPYRFSHEVPPSFVSYLNYLCSSVFVSVPNTLSPLLDLLTLLIISFLPFIFPFVKS